MRASLDENFLSSGTADLARPELENCDIAKGAVPESNVPCSRRKMLPSCSILGFMAQAAGMEIPFQRLYALQHAIASASQAQRQLLANMCTTMGTRTISEQLRSLEKF